MYAPFQLRGVLFLMTTVACGRFNGSIFARCGKGWITSCAVGCQFFCTVSQSHST